jgi:hypothetical protein
MCRLACPSFGEPKDPSPQPLDSRLIAHIDGSCADRVRERMRLRRLHHAMSQLLDDEDRADEHREDGGKPTDDRVLQAQADGRGGGLINEHRAA